MEAKMEFREKLRRLLINMNVSSIARECRIPAGNIHNYIHRGSIPGIGVAAKLARALGVDPGWLIDNSRGWPPVRVETSAPTIPQPKAA
jgi:hypothetical protein